MLNLIEGKKIDAAELKRLRQRIQEGGMRLEALANIFAALLKCGNRQYPDRGRAVAPVAHSPPKRRALNAATNGTQSGGLCWRL